MLRFYLLLFLASCQMAPKIPPNTLRISFMQDPATIDPRKSCDYTSSSLICLLFEGLTRCTSGSDVELAIAEKVTISEDQKTYTFSLRKTFWSDGHPLSAHDFEKSWKDILTPGFPAPCAYLLYPIKNAESYAKGLCTEVGIHALDDHTLRVELEQPTPYFLSLTAFPLLLPVPAHNNKLILPWEKTIVCNGPFIIEKMDPGSQLILKKNTSFWNLPKIHLDTIHISIVSDELTAIHLFEKGELDLVGGPLTPITMDILPKNLPFHLIPMAASTFCSLNTKKLSLPIRKALSAIQNHPKLVKEIEMMGQIPARHILPPSLRESFSDNVKETRAPIKLDPIELTLYYKGHPLEKKIAQTLQKIWEETLGIHIQIEQVESKSLINKLHTKNYQLCLAYWIAQFHDPINILERFKEETGAKNYPGWSSDEYKEYLAQNDLEKGEYLLEEQTVMIPLYHWNSPLLINPRVQGLSSTSTGGLLLERISLSKSSVLHH